MKILLSKSHMLSFLAGVLCAAMVAIIARPGLRVVAAELQWIPATYEDAKGPIEAQFRGFDTAMWEVGYRFAEFTHGGEDRNWPYATYQLEKIGHVVRLGIERRPKRADSARIFLEDTLPAVEGLLAEQTPDSFEKAFQRLQSGCMQCHVTENVPFFTVMRPSHRLAPIGESAVPPDPFAVER